MLNWCRCNIYVNDWTTRIVTNLTNVFFSRFDPCDRSLFEWTKVIQNEELKVAVDFSLCSICRRNPAIYTSLLELFAIRGPASACPAISFHSNKLNMETLARAAQSNSSLQQLIQSGILNQFSQAVEGIWIDCSFNYLFYFILFYCYFFFSFPWNCVHI